MEIKAAVIGATGYTGGEVLRYLLRHPAVRIAHCTSESQAGRSVASVHPDLPFGAGHARLGRDRRLEKLDVDAIARDTDVAFLCLPHGNSAKAGKKFLDRKVKVVDLSADYRLKSPAAYAKWYGLKHPHPQLLKSAVYGLPEQNRARIARADLVANPGCYATATALAFLPLLAQGLAKPGSLVADAKSGVSGAGKKLEAKYLFCEADENFSAYGVARHRHAPEIEQTLSQAAKRPVALTFVPHLLPLERGILVTAYADLKKKTSSAALREIYAGFYAGEPFVSVLPEGSFPELKSVQRTNHCQIGVRVDGRGPRAVIVGVIDNLGKGAAGQAVQNMNLMFGLGEDSGLK